MVANKKMADAASKDLDTLLKERREKVKYQEGFAPPKQPGEPGAPAVPAKS